MKKIYIIIWLFTLLSTLLGCQNNMDKKAEKSIEKNDYSHQVIIGYGWNSRRARIDDKEEIKRLEDLFNKAEFKETEELIERPKLRIYFHKDEGMTSFIIGANDVVEFGDGSYMKSQQIKSEEILVVFKEYLSKNRREAMQ